MQEAHNVANNNSNNNNNNKMNFFTRPDLAFGFVNKRSGYKLLILKVFIEKLLLRNGPDKNDSNNGNEHAGMQKRC